MTEPTWWDATIPMSLYPNADIVKTFFESMGGDRWAFGEEVGKETGYKHWQARIVFKKPKSLSELCKAMHGVNWQPTHVRDFDYVEKEGHYYRSWESALDKYKNLKLKPWEEHIKILLDNQSDREILILVDEKGGLGKTTYAKYLVSNHIMEYIPQMNSPKDYMHVAYAKKNANGYVIDLCMGQNFHKKFDGNWQATFFNALEQMKNGFLYDERNNWKECWTDSKKILVLMNQYPERGHIADDRMRVVHVVDDCIVWQDAWS